MCHICDFQRFCQLVMYQIHHPDLPDIIVRAKTRRSGWLAQKKPLVI